MEVTVKRSGGDPGGSNGQTRSASNPASTKPPRSIDQSPVSKPRSRPSVVIRSVVRRDIMATFVQIAVFRIAVSKRSLHS
jgi:hypothetical protein